MVSYDPDNFTAAIHEGYDDRNESYTVLVYKTGSLVITGSRTRGEALERYIAMCLLLSRYKLADTHVKKRFREDIDVESMGKALQILTTSFATEHENAGKQGVPLPVQPAHPANPPPADAGATAAVSVPYNSGRGRYEPPRKRFKRRS